MPALRDSLAPIPARDAQPFAPWSLPQFCAAQTLVISNEPASTATPPEPVIDEQALQALREEAYQAGFSQGEREGFAAGEQKAKEQAKQALDARLSSLQSLMQALFEPIAEQDQQIETLLLDLLQQLARAVIRRELQMDSSQILPLLREALSLLPIGANHLHLWVSGQDFQTVKAFRDHHNEHWRICEDPDLLPGGFRLESEHSRIDGTIEARLEQAFAQLAEQQREQRLHPPATDLSLTLSPDPSPASGRGEQTAPCSSPPSPGDRAGKQEQSTASTPLSHWQERGAVSPRPLAGEGPGERAGDAP